MATKTNSAVLKLRDAANLLIVPETTVRRLAEEGRLPGRCIDGEWRFSRTALLEWLAGSDGTSATAISPRTVPPETPEEQQAFLASIQAARDEIDRATGSGKYAPE